MALPMDPLGVAPASTSRAASARRVPIELRQAHLLEQLRKTGFVSVAEAAAVLTVPETTIRRDLIDLESEGRVVRTHGGASPSGALAEALSGANVEIRIAKPSAFTA
jgi:DeoR/GlpR family transcriptional regulator of sugar metabolism